MIRHLSLTDHNLARELGDCICDIIQWSQSSKRVMWLYQWHNTELETKTAGDCRSSLHIYTCIYKLLEGTQLGFLKMWNWVWPFSRH